MDLKNDIMNNLYKARDNLINYKNKGKVWSDELELENNKIFDAIDRKFNKIKNFYELNNDHEGLLLATKLSQEPRRIYMLFFNACTTEHGLINDIKSKMYETKHNMEMNKFFNDLYKLDEPKEDYVIVRKKILNQINEFLSLNKKYGKDWIDEKEYECDEEIIMDNILSKIDTLGSYHEDYNNLKKNILKDIKDLKKISIYYGSEEIDKKEYDYQVNKLINSFFEKIDFLNKEDEINK
ncbi:MAG: hypothetical protein ACRCUM_00245 [Mycoplasmoidaceae bacterium]